MKRTISLSLAIILLLSLALIFLSGCSSETTAGDPDHKGSYVVANQSFIDSLPDDDESFQETSIYFKAKVSFINDEDIYFTDENGNSFDCSHGQYLHDFEPYKGQMCECYCTAINVTSSFFSSKKSFDITFHRPEDARIVFEDGTIYSMGADCTMHDLDGLEDIVAYSLSEKGIETYHIINFAEKTVRLVIHNHDQWYYADGSFKDHPCHKPFVHYFEGLSEWIWLQGGSNLTFGINDNNAGHPEKDDLSSVQKMVDGLISSGQAVPLDQSNVLTALEVSPEVPVQTEQPTRSQPEQFQTTYILNTNTGVFHQPYCSSVGQMSNSNKQEFTGTRDEVISMGYKPCGKCHP